MLRLISLLLCVLPAAGAANVALLVGVGEYQQKFFEGPGGARKPTALSGIDIDIANMRKNALLLGFKAAEIRTLFNEQATLANIRAALKQIAGSVSARDRVLIYFSGHGSQTPDKNGDEADGLDELLVTYDFALTRAGFSSVLIDDEIAELLSAIPSNNTLMILDSCHSGTADRGFSAGSKAAGSKSADVPQVQYKLLPIDYPGVKAKDIDVRLKPAGTFTGASDRYVAITAVQEDEFASATDHGSVLTNAITAAITKAIKGNESITAERLFESAKAETEAFGKRAQAAGQPVKQHPVLAGNQNLKGINLRIVDNAFELVSTYADRAKAKLDFSADKVRVKSGEVINLTLKNAPRSGYLNLVQVGSVTNEVRVMFPNKYFSGTNKVEKGQTMALPSPDQRFEFYAKPPDGATSERVVLVAILSASPKNYSASGDEPASAFRRLSVGDERDFEIRPRGAEEDEYVGKIIVEVIR